MIGETGVTGFQCPTQDAILGSLEAVALNPKRRTIAALQDAKR
jgi:hypothetical protein